jgi:hypothetical protein
MFKFNENLIIQYDKPPQDPKNNLWILIPLLIAVIVLAYNQI